MKETGLCKFVLWSYRIVKPLLISSLLSIFLKVCVSLHLELHSTRAGLLKSIYRETEIFVTACFFFLSLSSHVCIMSVPSVSQLHHSSSPWCTLSGGRDITSALKAQLGFYLRVCVWIDTCVFLCLQLTLLLCQFRWKHFFYVRRWEKKLLRVEWKHFILLFKAGCTPEHSLCDISVCDLSDDVYRFPL